MANKVQAAAAIDTEVVFRCQHCKAELVVTGTDTGLSMNCSRCGKLTAVPRRTKRVATVDPAAQIEEIQRKLTENESQRTEISGYLNQLTIQLHRWQRRLQMLDERKQELEKELAALKT